MNKKEIIGTIVLYEQENGYTSPYIEILVRGGDEIIDAIPMHEIFEKMAHETWVQQKWQQSPVSLECGLFKITIEKIEEKDNQCYK